MAEQRYKRNWLEHTMLVFGVVLTLIVFGVLSYDFFMGQNSPADIVLSVDRIEPRENHYAVHVVATNRGSESAQDLIIEIKLVMDAVVERAELRFPYLPGGSEVKGWTTFTKNPKKANLELRVQGYGTP